jgi:CheY-like chemotaxis protein
MSIEPCKVLVVDDNRDCTDSTAMLLRYYGHTVHTAYDHQTALALAKEHQPDVIVMDIGLPGKHGFDLAADIRAACPDCRIIAFTGFTHDQVRRASEEAGFDRHLVKPSDPGTLTKVVEQECKEPCEKPSGY